MRNFDHAEIARWQQCCRVLEYYQALFSYYGWIGAGLNFILAVLDLTFSLPVVVAKCTLLIATFIGLGSILAQKPKKDEIDTLLESMNVKRPSLFESIWRVWIKRR